MNSTIDGVELKFEHALKIRSEVNCMQNMRNLMVCFTPVPDDIFSPGISPIYGPDDSPMGEYYAKQNKSKFKFPKPAKSINSKASPLIGQQQHQCSPSGDFQVTNENASFEMDLSASTDLASSLEVSSRSETSNISNVLDRTMDVSALLKSIGLGKYSEKFAKAGFDLKRFLKITPTELKSLGFESDDDCNAIMDMLNVFN